MYEKIRDSFLDGLGNYYATDEMPAKISVNMRRALIEHKNRLKSKGITFRERFVDNQERRAGETRVESGSFTGTTCYKHCNAITELSDGKSTVKCDDAGDDVVRLHVIDRRNTDGTVQDEDQIIVCPNCGHRANAVSFAGGCPMCSTKFEINEVYPCINSYYEMPWPMPKQSSFNKSMKVAAIGGVIVGIVIGIIAGIATANDGKSAGIAVLTALIAAFLCGWAAFVLFLLGSIAFFSSRAASGAISMAMNTLDMAGASKSRQLTEQAIRPYDPDFSFDVFEGKILSSLRTIAYSDNRQSCSIYIGNDDLSFMDDIVDIRYRGAARFDRSVEVDGYLHVIMTVYLDDIYYRNSQFLRRRENLAVELIRHKDVKTQVDFSAYSINCRNCGGSFDAVLAKQCPYCGTPYELATQDWSVIKIARTQ